MLKIKKVLNSSVVLATDIEQREFVLLGKGIGYAKKAGELINEQLANQIFIPIHNANMQRNVQHFSEIPPIFIAITQDIVQFAKECKNIKLSNSIFFSLPDHLNFAVERYKQKLMIPNRVLWEIKQYYQDEFNVGMYAINILNKQFDLKLGEDEAANISFHIINAEQDRPDNNALQKATLVSDIVSLLQYSLSFKIDANNFAFSRFIIHIKFFVDRLFLSQMLENDGDSTLFTEIKNKYPEAMKYAFKINDYIEHQYHTVITNEELLYLAIHIHRLMMKSE
ncbi:PRD domain-containing protein [Lonepinella koalarum]|uniref:PRD domain-containing protein n=1 Tax=Lonepinella koalarum TaxID=53417 RepID=UPI0011E3CB89|nr:PRD domain-containing protein [Lonepinella koalarum]TYG33642.1 PRD domain-containing protein [Lonepinella koalarum]